MSGEIEDGELVLSEEELRAEGPLLEEGAGRVVVPSKGKLFDSDGQVTVAIIRPCVSRGKRLRGLPPIYEPSMLGRNAGVFEDWHMWMGHLPASLAESLERLEEATGRRLFSELGGRVVKTWFDPEYRSRRDDDMGYRPGAVMGKVIPYEASRKILEADPDGLHVSIAAWPTSARQGSPSWNPGTKGMMIEGFRKTPRGSVDWVLRGGAGGAPVKEAEALALSVVESMYDPADHGGQVTDFAKMTRDQLVESLRTDNPDLFRSLGLDKKPEPAAPAQPGGLTLEGVQGLLEAQETRLREGFETKLESALEERDALVEEEVERRLSERDGARVLERAAHKLIESAHLPGSWTADLKRRYSVLPSGPSDALLCEADGEKDAEAVLRERVEADVAHAVRLIEEAGGVPRVRGLGGGAGVREGESNKSRRGKPGAFRQFVQESLPRGADELKDDDIKSMVREGVS